MTARCNLCPSDYRAFQRHTMFRYRKIHWLFGATLALILLLNWFGAAPETTKMDKIHALIGTILVFSGFTAVLLLVWSLVGRVSGSRLRGTLGEHIFELSDSGITESNANGKIETRLNGIRQVDETRHHFFVITATGLGHVLPKRDLESAEVLRALKAAVQRRAV